MTEPIDSAAPQELPAPSPVRSQAWIALAAVLLVAGMGGFAVFRNREQRTPADRFLDATFAGAADATGGEQGSTLQARGFVIGVPPGWEGRLPGFDYFDHGEARATLVHEGAGRKPPRLTVMVVGQSAGELDLAQAERGYLGGLSTLTSVERIGEGVSFTLDGTPARRFDFLETAKSGKKSQARVLVFAHDGTGYLVGFSALPEQFDAEVPALDRALQGWRFTD